jgi:DNA/RNA endonuclease G (NUC1)
MKKIKSLIYLSLFTILSQSVLAVDIDKFTKSISKAGYRAVDTDDEDKNIEKFMENNCTRANPWGEPKAVKDEDIDKFIYLCRENYQSKYDIQKKTPVFVSSFLTRNNLLPLPPQNIVYKGIMNDPDVPKKLLYKNEDYKSNTLYEPVSLSAVNDSYFNAPMKSKELLEINQYRVDQSYYKTNTVPMNKNLSKLWHNLEVENRSLFRLQNFPEIFIISGAIYLNNKNRGIIGDKGPEIPTHIYRIIINPVHLGALAYIFPNDGTANESSNIKNYVVNIKEIERLTNLYFFPSTSPETAAKLKLDVNELTRNQN